MAKNCSTCADWWPNTAAWDKGWIPQKEGDELMWLGKPSAEGEHIVYTEAEDVCENWQEIQEFPA